MWSSNDRCEVPVVWCTCSKDPTSSCTIYVAPKNRFQNWRHDCNGKVSDRHTCSFSKRTNYSTSHVYSAVALSPLKHSRSRIPRTPEHGSTMRAWQESRVDQGLETRSNKTWLAIEHNTRESLKRRWSARVGSENIVARGELCMSTPRAHYMFCECPEVPTNLELCFDRDQSCLNVFHAMRASR